MITPPNLKKANLGTIIKHFLFLFFPLFILTSSIIALICFIEIKNSRDNIEINEIHNINLQMTLIESNVKPIVEDLLILSNHHEMHSFLDNPDVAHRKPLENEFLLFSSVKRIYDQVRFIDDTGMEIVRINYDEGIPSVVPEAQLQSKEDRYYFKKTLRLGRNDMYISPFDLNVEQGRIEQPIKPMIRASIPVFDKDNRIRGIVVVNYLGKILLNVLGSVKKLGQTNIVSSDNYWLLNADGYWLKGSSPEDEWGFMYEDRKDRTFGNAFPEAWQYVSSSDTGQFHNSKGLFTYETIRPFYESADSNVPKPDTANRKFENYHWKVISHIPIGIWNANLLRVTRSFILLDAILALILAIGSWFFTLSRESKKKGDEALRLSEEQFRGAFEASAIGIVLLRPDREFISVNKAFCDMVEYGETELLATDFKSIIHPDDLEADSDNFRLLL